jgi:signal transduction histidine kinase
MAIRTDPPRPVGSRAAKLCVLLTLLAIVGVAAFWRYQEHQAIEAAGKAVTQAAARYAFALEEYLLTQTRELELLAKQLAQEEAPSVVFGRLAHSMAGSQRGYRWVVMLDDSGRVAAATQPDRLKDESRSQWFQALTRGDRSTIAVSSEDEAGVLAIAPLRGSEGTLRGGLIGLIPLTGFEVMANQLLHRVPLGPEVGTVEYQILAPDGELLLDSDLRQAGLLNLARLELPSAVAALSAPAGTGGYLEELHTRRHVAVLTGFAQLRNPAPYVVLVRIERSNVVAPVREGVWVYGGSIVLVLLAAAAILRAWGRQNQPEVAHQPRRSPPSPVVTNPIQARLPGPAAVSEHSQSEQTLRRVRDIEEVMGRAMERLVSSGAASSRAWLEQTVEALGKASRATRLSIFQAAERAEGAMGEDLVRHKAIGQREPNGVIQLHHWPRSGGAVDVRPISGGDGWHAKLRRGEVVWGDRTVPDGRSPLMVPIFVQGDWWGYLRFDQDDDSRHWTPAELDAMRGAARLLGAGLSIEHREQELHRTLCLIESSLDGADKGVALASANGTIVGFNRKFVEMWNVPEAVAESRQPDQTLAHLLTQVKAPEFFLRAMREVAGTSRTDSYDIVELTDGRVFERVSQPRSIAGDEVARMWTFTDITHGYPAKACNPAEDRETERIANDKQQLADVPGRLHALSMRLEAVREQERRRLAREIHDQLGQALTGLKLDLAWLGGKLARDYEAFQTKTQTMSELVSQTIQTVRRISTELRPPILDDLGLPAALEWQAHEFEARSGVSCRVEISPGLELDEPRATALFRIFQEILTNVARHANAQAVEVALRKAARDAEHSGDWALLVVRDDGRGITEEEATDPRSIGLSGMHERARMLGGYVSICGMPGRGTTVSVHIPMMETHHD